MRCQARPIRASLRLLRSAAANRSAAPRPDRGRDQRRCRSVGHGGHQAEGAAPGRAEGLKRRIHLSVIVETDLIGIWQFSCER